MARTARRPRLRGSALDPGAGAALLLPGVGPGFRPRVGHAGHHCRGAEGRCPQGLPTAGPGAAASSQLLTEGARVMVGAGAGRQGILVSFPVSATDFPKTRA